MTLLRYVSIDATYVTGPVTGPVTYGDEREVPAEDAQRMVATGSWELVEEVKVKKAAAKAEKEVQSQQ